MDIYNGCPRVFVLSSSIQLRNPTSFSALEIILLVRVKSKYAILTILQEYLKFSRFHTCFFNPPEKAHRRLEVQLIILLKSLLTPIPINILFTGPTNPF